MKIIRNNTIPFKGFAAVNLFGVLFIRGDTVVADEGDALRVLLPVVLRGVAGAARAVPGLQ